MPKTEGTAEISSWKEIRGVWWEGRGREGLHISLDVHEQLLPLAEVCTQSAVDVARLHIPQALVLEPHLWGRENRHVYR